MHIFTRKINQKIAIDDDIKIVILDIQGDQIKLGIDTNQSSQSDNYELQLLKQESQANIADG